MTKTLYKYSEDFGRMGYLEGLFVCDQKTVEEYKGREAYFGEVLGKHSDISTVEWYDNLEVLTQDQHFIETAEHFGVVPTGFNPIECINDEWDCED